MSDVRESNPEWWYWVVCCILLLWGVAYAWLSVFSFVFADAQDWAAMVEKGRILPEYVDYIANIPGWAVGLTGIAAITRLGGAIGLLLLQSWALWLYAASLLCVLVIMFRGFVLADVASVIRPSQIWVEALFLAMSVFVVWFAYAMGRVGLLH